MSDYTKLGEIVMLALKKMKILEARIALLENVPKVPEIGELIQPAPKISREDMPEMITCSLCKKSLNKRVFKSTDSRCLKCRSGII